MYNKIPQAFIFIFALALLSSTMYSQKKDMTGTRNPKIIQQYLSGKWIAPDDDTVTFIPIDDKTGQLLFGKDSSRYSLYSQYSGRSESGSEARFIWLLLFGENDFGSDQESNSEILKKSGAAIAYLTSTSLGLVSENGWDGNYKKVRVPKPKK